MSDLERAVAELAAAQADYQEAEDHYEGTPPEWFGSAKLRRALERTGVHWRLPFARTVVSAVRDRMEVRSVTSPDERIAAWIGEAWTANQMDAESDAVTEWGLVYGEAYLLVWPGDEPGETWMDYNSPRVMRLFYDAETGRRKEFAAKVWKEPSGRKRVNLYYADRLEKWISKKGVDDAREDREFIPFYDLEEEDPETGESEPVWPIPNEGGEVPVFHFRTTKPRGRPEHKDAYSPQQMVNKLVIGLMAANDFQGFPQRWAIAGEARADDLELDEDDLAFLESATSGDEAPTSSGSPSLKSGPGELWWLEGVKSVGEFPAAETDSFLRPLRFILEAMGSLTSTPTDFFLSAEGAAPSGESRRVAHAPLTKKAGDRKQNFGQTWEDAWSYAAMVGLGLRERPVVSLSWAPSESYDDGDSWEVASKKQAAGVPKKRTLLEQGYATETVDEWYPEEESDEVGVEVMSERVALLGNLADAAQKLGMAVQFGVMTEEQAQQTMASFLLDEALSTEEG